MLSDDILSSPTLPIIQATEEHEEQCRHALAWGLSRRSLAEWHELALPVKAFSEKNHMRKIAHILTESSPALVGMDCFKGEYVDLAVPAFELAEKVTSRIPLANPDAIKAGLLRAYSRLLLTQAKEIGTPLAMAAAIEEIRGIQETQQRSLFEVSNLESLSLETYEDRPLIDGLLDEGENLLIAGAGGAGKSLLAVNLALTLGCPPSTCGGKVWNQFAVSRPLRSLLVQSEVTNKGLNKRLKKMLEEEPLLRAGAKNVIIPRWGATHDCRISGDLEDAAFQRSMVDMCREAKADVLIIDPLVSFNQRDENKAEMRKPLDALTGIADGAGVTPILIHHLGKHDAETSRGHSAIEDWAANILILQKQRDDHGEATIKVTHRKSRNFELQEPFYLARTRGLNFQRAKAPISEGVQKEATMEEIREEIFSVVKKLALQGEFKTKRELANIVKLTPRMPGRDKIESLIDLMVANNDLSSGKEKQRKFIFNPAL